MPRTLPLRPGLKLGAEPEGAEETHDRFCIGYDSQNHVCFHKNRSASPLELVGFSDRSAQVSVKPQAAAIPAAVLTMHRY